MDIPVTNLGKPEGFIKNKKNGPPSLFSAKENLLSLSEPFEEIGLVRIYN